MNAFIVLQPIELWTGKQVFSVLLRPHASMRVYMNLTVTEKTYMKSRETMCPNDGFVYFRNSELVSGQLGKATLGKSLLYSCIGYVKTHTYIGKAKWPDPEGFKPDRL